MTTDKEHASSPLFKKGQTFKSDNCTCDSSIVIVKQEVGHYFGLILSPFCPLAFVSIKCQVLCKTGQLDFPDCPTP